jgi:hypothetical protein
MRSALLLLCLTGCAGSFEEAATPHHVSVSVSAVVAGPAEDPAYCRALDAAHRNWGAAAKGSAAIAGGAGIATIPLPADDKTLRLTFASVGIGFAALAAFSVFESEGAAVSWARDCAMKK